MSALWGRYTVGGATLNRFFVIHFLVPLVMCPLVVAHMLLLHDSGRSNPLGANSARSTVPFHPYITSIDMISVWFWLGCLGTIIFLRPHVLGCPDNFEKANPMKTPLHIQPEWYFLPYYAILRRIPHKAGGVVTMVGALLVFVFIASNQGREAQGMQNYLPREVLFFLFAANVVVLG